MQFDFKKVAEEMAPEIGQLVADIMKKEYQELSDITMDGKPVNEDAVRHLAAINTSIDISTRIAVKMMEKYHDELMKHIKK